MSREYRGLPVVAPRAIQGSARAIPAMDAEVLKARWRQIRNDWLATASTEQVKAWANTFRGDPQ